MKNVWMEIMFSLRDAGLNACWAIVGAKHSGSPMERLRWLCFATKSDLPPPRDLEFEVPGDTTWNRFSPMPDVSEWRAPMASVQFALGFDLTVSAVYNC
jgi:site-specific DNA-cytosine methylase